MKRIGAVLIAVAWAATLALVAGSRHGGLDSWRRPRTDVIPGLADPDFRLRDARNPAVSFTGAVVPELGSAGAWQGTYVDGDRFTGRLVSTPFPITADPLYLPVAGYPTLPGNRLTVELRARDGRSGVATYAAANPGETAQIWTVAVAPWIGGTGRVVLDDERSDFRGWLAVGWPRWVGPPRGPLWLLNVPRNYRWYALAAVAVTGMLLVPGMALRTWWPKALPPGAWALPLPGLLGTACAGFALWQLGPIPLHWLPDLWLSGLAMLSAAMAASWARSGPPLAGEEVADLAAWAGVAASALAFGVLPLRVDQEYDAGTTAQGRMIASPPDMRLPYDTADFFLHGLSGRGDHPLFFGPDWSLASRGPLAPLALAWTDLLFAERPQDPPDLLRDAWPAARDGYYLARIWGVLTNSLVVLGGIALARRMGGVAAALLAAAWLCAAPVVAINVDFVWPKLLATYFLLLAVMAVARPRGVAWAVLWSVLAYLGHPVAGLFVPALALFFFLDHRGAEGRLGSRPPGRGTPSVVDRSPLVRAAAYLGGCAAGLAPWLAYKAWLGKPDPFIRYPLGDGSGTALAASFGSWLAARLHNLEFTAVPGAFFCSARMLVWIEGALSAPARWGIGYAKSLPGALGLGAYFVAVALVLRRRTQVAFGPFRLALLAAPLGLMLLFWGYSADGLGRNCLEPLSVLLIVWTAAAWPDSWRRWRWLIGIAALESLSVRMIGILCDPSFGPTELSGETLGLAGVAALAALAPPALFLAAAARLSVRSEPSA